MKVKIHRIVLIAWTISLACCSEEKKLNEEKSFTPAEVNDLPLDHSKNDSIGGIDTNQYLSDSGTFGLRARNPNMTLDHRILDSSIAQAERLFKSKKYDEGINLLRSLIKSYSGSHVVNKDSFNISAQAVALIFDALFNQKKEPASAASIMNEICGEYAGLNDNIANTAIYLSRLIPDLQSEPTERVILSYESFLKYCHTDFNITVPKPWINFSASKIADRLKEIKGFDKKEVILGETLSIFERADSSSKKIVTGLRKGTIVTTEYRHATKSNWFKVRVNSNQYGWLHSSSFRVKGPKWIAEYPLDGDAHDISGNNLHGEVLGVVTFITDRKGNQSSACRFDGHGYISLPLIDLSNAKELTFSVWVNPIDTYYQNYIEICHPNLIAFGIIEQDFVVTPVYKANQPANPPRAPVKFNEWQHIVCTWRKGKDLRLYVNGILIDSESGVDIGQLEWNHTPVGEGFTGDLDEMLIYNGALDDDEIKLLYNK